MGKTPREAASADKKARVIDLGDGYSLREATILLDKSPTTAQVIFAPNGDSIVVPSYDGAFTSAAKAYRAKAPTPDLMDSLYDVEDAASILGRLVRMKRDEAGEPDDSAALQTAIDGVTKFIQGEATEVGQETTTAALAACWSCDHPIDCSCTDCPCTYHGALAEAGAPFNEAMRKVRETGRRNSARDEGLLKQIADLVKQLGIDDPAKATEPDAPTPVAEAQVDKAATPESIRFREATVIGDLVTIAEANPMFDTANRTVWITPIKPGWGNARDNNFYPTDTLKAAVKEGKFDNVKMYRDHPRKSDEKDLPERSVKDWFATTREAVWDDAKGVPRLPIKVHDQAVLTQWQDAPEQVAFSLLGGGVARPGEVSGKRGKVIESIKNVGSVDWVTQAGAGGEIAFAESASSEELDVEIENLTVEQLGSLKESNKTLYDHLVGLAKALPGDAEPPKAEAPKVEVKKDDAPAAPAAADTKTKEAEEPEWAKNLRTLIEGQAANQAAATLREAAAANKTSAGKAVATTIAGSTLIKKAKDAIAVRFAEATFGDGTPFKDEAAVVAAVTADIAMAESLLGTVKAKSQVTGLGNIAEGGSGEGDTTIKEAAEKQIGSRMGSFGGPPAKPKLVWSADELQGLAAQGRLQPEGAPLNEAALSEAGKAVQADLAARL